MSTTTSATTKKGYVNGSDLLLYIDDKAVGHCTSHKISFSSDTKERAVKPLASASISAGLWKNKGVTGLSYSVDADGLRFYNESECGYKTLLGLWKEGKPVTIKAMERESTDPYLVGKCIIKSLDEDNPGQDDATYSVSLENDGEPETLDASKITETPEATE
mgnify:CR=1 FL=1